MSPYPGNYYKCRRIYDLGTSNPIWNLNFAVAHFKDYTLVSELRMVPSNHGYLSTSFVVEEREIQGTLLMSKRHLETQLDLPIDDKAIERGINIVKDRIGERAGVNRIVSSLMCV